MAYFIFVTFLFGLIIGSFLNALLDRLHSGESMMHGRSHCDSCGHVLEPVDLIPFFSWLFLGGKCRYCKAKIPVQNPLVELTTGLLFVVSLASVERTMIHGLGVVPGLDGYGYSVLVVVFFCIVSAISVIIFVYDLYNQIILDSVLVTLLGVIVLFHGGSFLMTGSFIWGLSLHNIVLSAIFSGLPYLLLILATQGKGMGGGDMKLAFVMGALLGYPRIIVAHYIAFLIGGLVAVILLLAGKKHFGQAIAFGPFLISGMLVALFWGDILLQSFLFSGLFG